MKAFINNHRHRLTLDEVPLADKPREGEFPATLIMFGQSEWITSASFESCGVFLFSHHFIVLVDKAHRLITRMQ